MQRNVPRRHDLLHRIVAGIGDEDIAAAVYCDALGAVEAAAQRNDAGVTARRQNLLHCTVAGIGDEDVAARVYRDAAGAIEPTAQRSDGPAEVRSLRLGRRSQSAQRAQAQNHQDQNPFAPTEAVLPV